MSYIIILGGGIDQLPTVIESKKIGLKTLVFDKNKKCIAKDYSDYFYNVSARNYKKIIDTLLTSKINLKLIKGIMVAGTDIPQIASRISERLNIYYPINLNAAENSTNKVLMKNNLIDNKILTPKFKVIGKFNEFIKNLKENPKVLKPDKGSGSRGVFKVSKKLNKINLKDIFVQSLKISQNKILILEDFIEGDQISTESLIYNNKIYTFGLALRNYIDTKVFLPQFLENGGIQPYPKYLSRLDEINKLLLKIVNANNIKNGVIKADLVIQKKTKKIYVIEYALRLSGGDFSSFIIPKSTGFNFIKNCINIFINKEIKINKNIKNYKFLFANRYLFLKDQKIKKIKYNNKVKKYIIKFEQLIPNGTYIGNITSHAERSAVFIVKSINLKNLQNKIKKVYDNLIL